MKDDIADLTQASHVESKKNDLTSAHIKTEIEQFKLSENIHKAKKRKLTPQNKDDGTDLKKRKGATISNADIADGSKNEKTEEAEPIKSEKKPIMYDTASPADKTPTSSVSKRFKLSKSASVSLDPEVHEKFCKKLLGDRKDISDPNIQPTNDRKVSSKKDASSRKSRKSTKKKRLTPLEKQIIALKKENPDKILAVQVGYKYKFFGQDAQIASKILNIMYIPGRIALDGSEDELYDRFAYCSIPDTRLHVHLRRLLYRGLKVGVVEQRESAIFRQANGVSSSKLFERKLTHIYTSGTYVDAVEHASGGSKVSGRSIVCLQETFGHEIEDPVENYATSVSLSIAAINAYSGEITYDDFKDLPARGALETRLVHLEPIEIIVVGPTSKESKRCIDNFRLSLEAGNGSYSSSRDESLRIIKVLGLPTAADVATKLASSEIGVKPQELILDQPVKLQSAFCELIKYMTGFGMVSAFQIVENYRNFSSVDQSMILDSDTVRNLELFHNLTTGTDQGTLFWILDHTSTSFGKRMLRRWLERPLIDRERIMERSGAIKSILAHNGSIPIETVSSLLRHCPDLELSLSRIHYGRSNRKEVYLFVRNVCKVLDVFTQMKRGLVADVFESPYLVSMYSLMRQVATGAEGSKNDDFDDSSTTSLAYFRTLLPMIYSPAAMDPKMADEHVVKYFDRSFYDYACIEAKMEEVESMKQLLEDELKPVAQQLSRNGSGIKYITNNGERYLVEVRNTKLKTVPASWVKINGTKSVSRFRPPSVAQLFKKLLFCEESLRQTCDQCFKEFVRRIDKHYVVISRTIKTLATFDCLFSLSVASSLGGLCANESYSRPSFVDKPIIDIKSSRNPITETLRAERYIANSFKATEKNGRVAIITGPNMGGKSSFIRQIALIVIMAQIGCYIPAASGSVLGVFDSIFVRMGAYDDIVKGRSTFQVEMSETKSILDRCTDHSLVLLDEIGRGTSSVDGCALAYSILHYLCFDKLPFVLFITHFQSLQVFESVTHQIARNYHLGFRAVTQSNNSDKDKDYSLVFTYKLTPGPSARSYGVYCAKLAGISFQITQKASLISKDAEKKWLCHQMRSVVCKYKQSVKLGNYSELWKAIDDFE